MLVTVQTWLLKRDSQVAKQDGNDGCLMCNPSMNTLAWTRWVLGGVLLESFCCAAGPCASSCPHQCGCDASLPCHVLDSSLPGPARALCLRGTVTQWQTPQEDWLVGEGQQWVSGAHLRLLGVWELCPPFCLCFLDFCP